MPATEDHRQSNWLSPIDALRRVQELGAQLTAAARAMADDVADSPGGQIPESMARWGERAVELSTLWVAPVRAVLEEQQELIDAVSSWAAEQRKLAERFEELARRHRELTEQVLAAISPTLDQADRLAGRKPKKRSTAKSSA